jgi:hypothetical protein
MIAARTLTAFKRLRYGAPLVLLMFCGFTSEPTSSNIKAAIQAFADGLSGDRAPIFEEVAEVACKEAQGKPGYFCSFKATSFNKTTNTRSSRTMEGRFIQQDTKWRVTYDR